MTKDFCNDVLWMSSLYNQIFLFIFYPFSDNKSSDSKSSDNQPKISKDCNIAFLSEKET